MITLGLWNIQVDAEKTAHVYKTTSRQGAPIDCNCETCCNFKALGESAFPEEFRKQLAMLGVDFHKAAEIYVSHPVSSGRIGYGGWFHFIGKIISGSSLYYEVGPEFRMTLFEQKRDLAFEEFRDMPLVQLEFMADLPWVLSSKSQPS